MWGIQMPPFLRPLAQMIARYGPKLGIGHRLVPTTTLAPYVQINGFAGNTLTNDQEMYEWMVQQVARQSDLALGGPTIQWLGEGLQECARLAARPSPDLPCVTFLGSDEQIVAHDAIHDRMGRGPGGDLELVDNAQHEGMMEGEAIRARTFDRIAGLFRQHG
jgi:lysophospholipase